MHGVTVCVSEGESELVPLRVCLCMNIFSHISLNPDMLHR